MSLNDVLQSLPAVLIFGAAALMFFSKPCDARGNMRPQFVFCLCVLFVSIGAALSFYNG
jgi:hypothetical protein